ncbi:hypothetical protein FB451DRAFT_1439767 [Mycena latifolia]|nr:hypothetical protein FB451DRAFT_1439767 [Mycena latifolia]
MPVEVLGERFSWTLPSVTEARDRRRLDVADGPWMLTHVSSRWRAVAFSTPALWSLIAIVRTRKFVSRLSMVKTQIQRARKLSIHFYGNEQVSAKPQIEMLKLLVEYSARWETPRFQLSSQLLPLLPTLRNRLPPLRRLWIQWDPKSRLGVDSIDCFHTAPSPVDVDDQPIQHLDPFVIHSSCLIQRLCLRGCANPQQVTETLHKLPSIIVLAIIAFCYQEINSPISSFIISPDVGPSTFMAPQLRSLHFGCRDARELNYTEYLEMSKSRWKTEPHFLLLRAQGQMRQRRGVWILFARKAWTFRSYREQRRRWRLNILVYPIQSAHGAEFLS